jgi:hypothetical protein
MDSKFMFKADQLRELIIKPTLLDLVMFSEPAMELLVFTCAVESNGGTYLKQTKGPALGIYQMEPETHNDIWQNYIKFKNNILVILSASFGLVHIPSEDRLIYDLRYATVMARLHYERVAKKLPEASDVEGLWNYYKNFYNTSYGAADKDHAIEKYSKFIKN